MTKNIDERNVCCETKEMAAIDTLVSLRTNDNKKLTSEKNILILDGFLQEFNTHISIAYIYDIQEYYKHRSCKRGGLGA